MLTALDKLLIYPTAVAIVVLALTGCLGPGEGREIAQAPAHHAARPIPTGAVAIVDKPTLSTNPTPLSEELLAALTSACDQQSIPVCVGLGLIEVESSFRVDAVSPSGCYGLAQLNPAYFPADLTPADNLQAGMAYLREQLDRYHTLEAALTAYNAGRDTGDRTYSTAVLAAAEQWEEIV